MLTTLLVLVPFGLALGALSLAALSLSASRRSRVNAAAGRPAAPPSTGARRGAAVPRPDIEPIAERQPYDSSGVLIGEVQEQ